MKYNIKQKNLEKVMHENLAYHTIIVTIIMIIALCNMQKVAITKNENTSKNVGESYSDKTTTYYTSNLVTFKPQAKAKEELNKAEINYCYELDLSAEESYLLAKIAMAEAEECNTQTKTLIIMCVLNRVWSDEFPDTIEEVIFQENQFSPIDNGRWDRVEPNEDCYEAVKVVMEAKYDYSGGATYFENCTDEDNWHSRNLEFLYESQGIRFYK